MPRLKEVPLADAEPDVARVIYEFMFGDKDPVKEPGTETGTPGNWWTVWAQSPESLFGHMTAQMHSYRGLSHHVREVLLTRVGFTAGSKFVFSQHRKGARAAGLPDEKMDEIVAWAASDKFDPMERALLAYADELVLARGRVQDITMDRLKEHFSDRDILDITFLACMYVLHATMCQALRLEYDDVPERIVEEPVPGDSENGGPNEKAVFEMMMDRGSAEYTKNMRDAYIARLQNQ